MRARVLAVVCIWFLLAGCSTNTPAEQTTKDVKLFPHFKLTSVDGSQFDSADLKGKVVLVNFWATWCGPCRLETPWLVEYKEQYRDQGFEVVGIALDPENKDEIAAFAKEFKVNYPLIYSDGKIETESGGLIGVPTSYLINRRGETITKHSGTSSIKSRLQKKLNGCSKVARIVTLLDRIDLGRWKELSP